MVASQKRRPGSQDGSSNVLLLVVGAVLFIGLFLVGLNWGGKSEGKKSVLSANELHHREEALREQMRECDAKSKQHIADVELLDETSADIRSRNKKLEERNKELYEEHSAQEHEIAKCQEETETQVAIFTEEDEQTKRRIQSLTEEVAVLQTALSDLTNGYGMRTVLLSATFENLQKNYNKLVSLLNDTETFPAQSTDQIVAKHEERLSQQDAAAENTLHSIKGIIANWTHWRYDAKEHADIFLETIDGDGEVILPLHFNRSGNPDVKVMRKSRFLMLPKVTSVSERLVSMLDFGICAMRLQNPNFTFPNTFYWHTTVEKDLSTLFNIVSTPLITLCESCFDRRRSPEFKIACDEELAHTPYGGHEFWKARSLIRYSPHVEHEADNFIFANGLKGKKYLSVVMHSDHETFEKCEKLFHKSPGNHYLYIRGNFDTAAPPLTRDADLQCAPTWEQIVERVKTAIKDDDDVPFDAVYLSITPYSMERVRYEDLPGLNIVMLEQHSATDEAVDTVVASRASRILVSPFLPTSQIVTELFLLRNQLNPGNNVQFF